MKKNVIKIFTSLVVLTTLFTACSKSKFITNDFDEAKIIAAESKKDILLVVTVDGDDATSTQFITNILNDSSFKSAVEKNYVVAHLDFSANTYKKTVASEDLSDSEKKAAETFANTVYRNSIFANQLNVASTPSAFILTKEPYLISEIQFDAENPDYQNFMNALDEASKKAVTYHEKLSVIESGSDAEKIAAIDWLVEETDVTRLVLLADKVQLLLKLDPQNETGLVSKYLLLDAKIQASNFMSGMDINSASLLFENLAKSEFLSAEDIQDSYYNAAYVLTFSSNPDIEKIVSLLSSAIDAAPESDAAENLKEIYDNLVDLLDTTSLGE